MWGVVSFRRGQTPAVTSGVLPGVFSCRAQDKNQAYFGPENETPSDVTLREVLRSFFTRTEQNAMKSAKMEWANTATFQQASLWLQSVPPPTHKATPLKAKHVKVSRASSWLMASLLSLFLFLSSTTADSASTKTEHFRCGMFFRCG